MVCASVNVFPDAMAAFAASMAACFCDAVAPRVVACMGAAYTAA